jgi:hypothetical protein
LAKELGRDVEDLDNTTQWAWDHKQKSPALPVSVFWTVTWWKYRILLSPGFVLKRAPKIDIKAFKE